MKAEIRALISDAYSRARSEKRTTEQAADDAATAVTGALIERLDALSTVHPDDSFRAGFATAVRRIHTELDA